MWALFALIASILGSVQAEINKNYKIDGFRLNTYRSFISVLLFLPFIGFIEWNLSAYYYFIVFTVSAVSVIAMMMQYNLAAKKNGRVACLHQPLGVIVTFVFWLCLDNSQIDFLAQHWVNTLGILAALILFGYGFQKIRKNDVSSDILPPVISMAVLFSIGGTISKLALETNSNIIGTTLNFVMMCNLFMFIISFPIFLYSLNKKKFKLDNNHLKGAFLISASGTASWLLFCTAIIYSSNPAYVNVIMGLTPVWFLVYYKYRNIKDDSNPIAGLIIALSAILIIIFG